METKNFTVSENQFAPFNTVKVQDITMAQLNRTQPEDIAPGIPVQGIYHYQFFAEIMKICQEFGYNPEVYDMFAAQSGGKTPGVVLLPQLEKIHGERSIESHLVHRCFANIRLTDFDDDVNTTNIAVAWHQRGIQLGMGNMVKICHNQCMLNADQYTATYSEKGNGRGEKVTYEDILATLRGWLTNARERVEAERAKLERMKQIDITAEQMFTIIGMLTSIRVAVDTQNKEIRKNEVYPLNQSQISSLTEDMMLRYHRNGKVTAYDLYDGATELYKAKTMDIPMLMPQNRALTSFLDERFGL